MVLQTPRDELPNLFWVIVKKITLPEGFNSIDDQEIEYDYQMYIKEDAVLSCISLPENLVPKIFSPDTFTNPEGKMYEIGEMNDLGSQNPFPFLLMESFNGKEPVAPDVVPIVNVYNKQDENCVSKVNYFVNYEKLKKLFDVGSINFLRSKLGLTPTKEATEYTKKVIHDAATQANHGAKEISERKNVEKNELKEKLEKRLQNENNKS